MGGTEAGKDVAISGQWGGLEILNLAILASLVIYPSLYYWFRKKNGKTVDYYRLVQAILAGPNVPIAACMVIGVAFPTVGALVTSQGVFLAMCGGIVLFSLGYSFQAD
jgi:hypothetical protein